MNKTVKVLVFIFGIGNLTTPSGLRHMSWKFISVTLQNVEDNLIRLQVIIAHKSIH